MCYIELVDRAVVGTGTSDAATADTAAAAG
jgi:hypothetical protein